MKIKSILITGVNGFVGEYVVKEFHRLGYRTHGIARDAHAGDKVKSILDQYTCVDMLDKNSLSNISFKNISATIHLAGLAAVGESFEQPERYMKENGIMVNNLLSSALYQDFKGRTVIVSTGALYDSNQALPFNETSTVKQTSPYVVGKLFAEDVSQYYKNRGQDVVIARPFNHIGPGQKPGFLFPDLYKQILNAKQSGLKEIVTGDLSSRRDYTDVRDITKAYILLATAISLKHTVYNISSGHSLSGQEILDQIKKITDTSDITSVVDRDKLRPNDIHEIIGNSSRITEELGWKSSITIEQTVFDIINS